ncbi:MAG: 1-(5-phosphoribosyl)-5-[(5-phosphoribosylamino)methylideneamino]imidazole-4-carboxamide isomerase [Bacteroidetes bacterium]|nr:1-(5-phosphoribosyl)-5-[(5-phosphoribosylamino)methylideneamino]imidazole-4-carboxamide isomerase [Bacteroidota bacterium]
MRIIPAIDIINGKCVRLTQGDFSKMKVYNEDPVEVAKEFEEADLEYLHLIDLDGAKKGEVVNWKVIRDIQEDTALQVDFGGGVKTEEEVQELLYLGINQINVGSVAVKEPEKFIGWMKKFGSENFILSADVKGENVSINGWLESTEFRLFDLVSKFADHGLEYITVTDIATDGMLKGPNFGLYKKLMKKFPDLKIIASGGVSSIDDLKELKHIKVFGAIVGKAIYEGHIQLDQLKSI